MSQAPRSRPLAFDDIDDVAAAVRERGGRFSTPRRLVLKTLFAAEGPVSAEYIARGVDAGTFRLDLSSVYRTLEHLEQLGVIRHVHVGHGPGLYALVRSTELEYLVCERCNRVTSVAASSLDPVRSQIREAFGYEARFGHFPIIGLCASCAADARPDSTGDTRTSPPDHSHEQAPSHGERAHEHPQAEHEHGHSHGDYVHSHPHVHEKDAGGAHEHTH